MLLEYCAQNLTGVREALVAGAGRVELCDDLQVGGITPSIEVMERAVEVVHDLDASVMVMVRPRGGDFAYNRQELQAMRSAIGAARLCGADGVVFGCVCNGELDVAATRELADEAAGLDTTFHMAFDSICPELQAEALRTLANMGFSRVLTHGGSLGMPIEQCMPRLRELVKLAGDAIGIMPGGGVTYKNVRAICDELGVDEAHGTRIVHL